MRKIRKVIKRIEELNFDTRGGRYGLSKIIKRNRLSSILIKLVIEPHSEVFFIRARPLLNTTDFIRTVSGHSYNPNPNSVNIGRANRKKQAVFYLGRVRTTSLAEVDIIGNINVGETK